jgi:hypothetical protein
MDDYIIESPVYREENMKSFFNWLKEENLELPTFDAPAAEKTVEAGTKEKSVEEKTKRTGLSANYPAAYVSGQYPHKYFNPSKATADLDIQNIEKKDTH